MCDVSIIVPVYNTEKYLKECVDALINQTHKNIEILIIDDGSKEECAKLCDSFTDERVRVFHQKNGGVSSARNKGIDEAKGKYICFVDSDDVVDKNYCLYMIEAIQQNCKKVCACKYSSFVDSYPEIVEKGAVKVINSSEKWSNVLQNNASIEGYLWNKIYAREIVGDIRFSEQLSLCEDQLFCFQVLDRTDDVVYIDSPLYHYRDNISGATKSLRPKQIEQAITVGEQLINIVSPNCDEATLAGYQNNVAMWYYRLGWKVISYSTENWYQELKRCRMEYKRRWDKKYALNVQGGLVHLVDEVLRFCFSNVPILFIVFIKIISLVKK